MTVTMNRKGVAEKRKSMYFAIIGTWTIASALLWTDSVIVLQITDSTWGKVTAGLIAFLIDLGWLYGFYHIGILAFTLLSSKSLVRHGDVPSYDAPSYPIAVLHTVCDDFQSEPALSCVSQEYADFHVYLLDDSLTDAIKQEVEDFGSKFENLVTVVRRMDRKGFKAGNINNALSKLSQQYAYIALADSDTFLPREFLKMASQLLEANPDASFVQAVHVANTFNRTKLAKDLGEIVRIGWNYYQPVRNKYGFPMCYGHGALIRMDALKAVGGFPEIVSEDIGLTLKLRRLGLGGLFTSDVICGEDYPDDYRTFRKRLSRWVSADMECFRKELLPFLSAKKVGPVEKLDAAFRGLKVPLAAIFLPLAVTTSLLHLLDPEVDSFISSRVILITLVTSLAPYICFVVDMVTHPRRLFAILSQLTTLYCSNSLLYTVRTVEAVLLKRARFYVTGAKFNETSAESLKKQVLTMNKAGYPLLGLFEAFLGASLIAIGLYSANMVLVGLSTALVLAPAIYALNWENRWISLLIRVPFPLILIGIVSSCFLGIGSPAQCLALAGLSILLF